MDKSCRGIACIINVFRVHGQKERNGTQVDCDRLNQLFTQLHFKVAVFNDKDDLRADVSFLDALLEHIGMSVYQYLYNNFPLFIRNYSMQI